MLLLLGLACGSGALTLPGEPADSPAPDSPSPPRLADRVTAEGLLDTLEALQAIADAHGGHRAFASEGYAASIEHVRGRLEDAGYAVTVQPFELSEYVLDGPATLTVSIDLNFTWNVDFGALSYGGSGAVRGPLAAVDLTLPPTARSSSTSGCEPEDWAGFPAGAVALVQRGGCTFARKADQAALAGASGLLIFNEGQAGRRELFDGGLAEPAPLPVLALRFEAGQALVDALAEGEVEVSIDLPARYEPRLSWNLLAELPGAGDGVVMLGAHLDSVGAGPGINDNGTGSAAALALALAASEGPQPAQTLRFAWWGAEELGLVGSSRHVAALDAEALARLTAYVNLDMLGSPNGARLIYSSAGAPPGSDTIAALFAEAFAAEGLEAEPVDLDGRSDHAPFWAAGVPVGGLFSGAEQSMTAAQARRFDGQAGAAFDPCYHQECDTISNVDLDLTLEMARATAEVVEALSRAAPRRREALAPGEGEGPARWGHHWRR